MAAADLLKLAELVSDDLFIEIHRDAFDDEVSRTRYNETPSNQ